MPKKCNTEYIVVCTRGIAAEMCRYEHATVVEESLVSRDPYSDETWDYDKYRFVIKSPNFVPLRWKSFGVVAAIV